MKIVGLLSAILGIVGFVTTKPADGGAREADTPPQLESPPGANESRVEVSEEPRPSASATILAPGEWTVRLGIQGEDGTLMKCTISEGGRFTCPDACGRKKPTSGTLKLDEAGKKLTETYSEDCSGKSNQLLYDVEHVDRATLALRRGRDWQNWSLVE